MVRPTIMASVAYARDCALLHSFPLAIDTGPWQHGRAWWTNRQATRKGTPMLSETEIKTITVGTMVKYEGAPYQVTQVARNKRLPSFELKPEGAENNSLNRWVSCLDIQLDMGYFPTRPMPGQEPNTPADLDTLRALVSDAAEGDPGEAGEAEVIREHSKVAYLQARRLRIERELGMPHHTSSLHTGPDGHYDDKIVLPMAALEQFFAGIEDVIETLHGEVQR